MVTSPTEIYTLSLHDALPIFPFLEYDTRVQKVPDRKWGYLSSAMMGVFFSAGWAPCVGPVLGSILTLSLNGGSRSEEHTSELQSQSNLVCRLLLEKKKNNYRQNQRHLHTNIRSYKARTDYQRYPNNDHTAHLPISLLHHAYHFSIMEYLVSIELKT